MPKVKANKPEPVPTTYDIIGLTENEVQTLMFIFDRIGGAPKGTPRGCIDSIKSALWTAGARPGLFQTESSSAIYFK